jgi:intein/homing endonuclease
MSFVGMGLGQPSTGLRFATTRGRIQGGSMSGVNYPSPFFDVAHTYLPTTVKQMFRWCRYYFLTNPLINATVFKLSEYPVTDIIIDHKDASTSKQWKEYLEDQLRYRAFQIEVGLDTFCYGISFVSPSFPFNKYLKCSSCDFSEQAKKIRDRWTFTNFQFRLTCPKCGTVGEAVVKDFYVQDPSGMRLVRWNPEDVEISVNELTGHHTFFYNIPGPMRSDITIGKKDIVEGVPQIFIQSLRQQKGVIFSQDMLFMMKRPTISNQDRGWGLPLLLPVLKDAFYLQLMKKSQESILLEHITPMRVLFPQAGSGSSDPFCLSGKSIVEANMDYARADAIRAGDLVKTATGKLLPVTAVVKRPVLHSERVFSISVCGMGAFPVEASEKHPFLAVQMHGKQKRKELQWTPSWVDAADLRVGDYVAYPLRREVRVGMCIDMAQYLPSYTHTADWVYQQITEEGAAVYEFVEQREQVPFRAGELQQLAAEKCWSVPTLQTAAGRYRRGHRTHRIPRFMVWSEELAVVLGYYLAEGCVNKDKVVFALHAKETWICDELDAAFAVLTGRKGKRVSKEPNGLNYVMHDAMFSAFLKNFGGHLAWNKKFPAEVVQLPERILRQLVRCIINGDGGAEYCTRDNVTGRPCRTSSVTFTSTSASLALKLRELLLFMGVVGKVHSIGLRDRAKHTIYRVKVNGQAAIELWRSFGWEVPEELVQKDTTRAFIKGEYAFFRIRSKSEVVEEFVYGFQVDGDKSFCVPACATHNTTINLDTWRDHVAQEIARWRMDCVAPDALVETRHGLMAARDVTEGMELRNHKGVYSSVEKVWRRPLREGERAYKVIAEGLPPSGTVSEGHPFYVVRGTGTPKFVRAKNLRVGDLVGYPVEEGVPEASEIDSAYTRACGVIVDSARRSTAVFNDKQAVEDLRVLLLRTGAVPEVEERGEVWLLRIPSTSVGVIRDGCVWHRVKEVRQVETDEVIGFQMDKTNASVTLEDDTEAHGTFCLWGMASANTNYIPIMPLPLGQQTVGGDGKALLLTQEMQMWSEQILNGMQVPREFVMGGLSYSGTSVSMRMMENMFLGYIQDHTQLLRFVMQRVASFLKWPMARGHFKPFKMADDLQRLSLMMQANANNKISDTTFLSQLDLSEEEEGKIKLKELSAQLNATEKQQLATAEIQGKAQMIMLKYQSKAQMSAQQDLQQPQAPGEPGGPENLRQGTPGGQEQAAAGEGAPANVEQQAASAAPAAGAAQSVPEGAQSSLSAGQRGAGLDLRSWAMAQAQSLATMPKQQQEVALQNLQQQNPDLAALVRQLLSQVSPEQEQAPATDMRPLPEKLPPRRAAQII